MGFIAFYIIAMGAGGLCYPRRPRMTGIVFVLLATITLAVWAASEVGGFPILAVTPAALGLGALWRFRDPEVRASHVAEWTAQD